MPDTDRFDDAAALRFQPGEEVLVRMGLRGRPLLRGIVVRAGDASRDPMVRLEDGRVQPVPAVLLERAFD